jgi:hypothetical protein
VYALQGFLVVLLIWLYTTPSLTRVMDGLCGLVLGFALANHVTTLLLIPLFLLVGAARPAEKDQRAGAGWHFSLSSFAIQLLGLALGASLYLLLPLRAGMHPPVNWGNPTSWSRLWWLVSGNLYQSYYLQFDPSRLLQQSRSWAQFAVKQLGFFGIFLGLLGLVVFGKWSRLVILTTGVAAVALAFSFVYHPADADVYLLPLLISSSIWLGLGMGHLAELLLKRSPALAMAISLLILNMILVRSLSQYQQVDASQDSRAEDFARQILAGAPRDAILFGEGDGAIFALWYFHFALHERPDVVVIARDLVTFDWYGEVLAYTYPTLVVPGPILFPETIILYNAHRPVCQVKYSEQAEMECTPSQ